MDQGARLEVMNWLDNIRAQPVLTVARDLGLETKATRGASAGSIFGCPACSAVKRHTKSRDKRGAIGLRGDGKGWQCHQCDQTGDGLDLVSWKMTGERFAETHDKTKVIQWCKNRFGGDDSTPPPRAVTATVVMSTATVSEEPEADPAYLTDEAIYLWDHCHRLTSDADAVAYVKSRGVVDPSKLESWNLCRVLPKSFAPKWTWHSPDGGVPKPWAETGHRLIFPLYDVHGQMRSVLARAIVPSERKSTTAGPRSGLILLDGVICDWLRRNRPDVPCATIHITEGEIDFMLRCESIQDQPLSTGVAGIMSGSWKRAHALAMPRHVHVSLETDHDAQGDKYAADIVGTFNGLDASFSREIVLP